MLLVFNTDYKVDKYLMICTSRNVLTCPTINHFRLQSLMIGDAFQTCVSKSAKNRNKKQPERSCEYTWYLADTVIAVTQTIEHILVLLAPICNRHPKTQPENRLEINAEPSNLASGALHCLLSCNKSH